MKSDLDFFSPLVNDGLLHSNFKTILKTINKEKIDIFNEWARGFIDRDNKIVKEFQTTFNSTFWEIYLFAVLKEYKIQIDFNYNKPDFVLKSNHGEFIIEAVTTNSATGKANEWDRDLSKLMDQSITDINKEAIIRLSNSFTSKAKHYISNYSKLPYVAEKPFVIAIAPFEQPFFNLQHDRPIKALLYDYYVDEDAYTENPSKYPSGPPVKKLGTIEKDNGTLLELGFFNDDFFSYISAVIFSCTATWGKVDVMCDDTDCTMFILSLWGHDDQCNLIFKNQIKSEYKENLTDGIQIYHNPFAKHPLNPNIFRKKGVSQIYFDESIEEWVHEEQNERLCWRQVFNLIEHR